ncbi:MAG: type I phosphomannose isomerase catalytic subunit [Candidatus Izemoplasmatales bacterium]|nr:type I phosphomannose isomerase catalytic subunit [Candidatus Izemoplasmatales bacterium]
MIIKFEPIPLKKVWGGDKLSKTYGFSLSNIGEVWGISAHKLHSNKIINSDYRGMTFRELFKSHRECFGHYSKEEFPLLFKVIDASGDLSVQVHPDDEYASTYEDSYGKDECWYILAAGKDSRIQIGHKAKSKTELHNSILNNKVEKMLKYYKIKAGDYFYIPSGKVHAICKNTTLLEVSQSSDITYRLYDYNRLDNGSLRPLHIDKSLDVITIPDNDLKLKHDYKYFSFNVIYTTSETTTADLHGDYIYVIEGNGMINNEKIKKGDFLMVTSLSHYAFDSQLKIALIRINN